MKLDPYYNHHNNDPDVHPNDRWIRPPIGKSVCPYTGLRHAKFYSTFVDNPLIRQTSLAGGKERGVRVMYLPDIMDFLHRMAQEQMSKS